MRILRTNNPFGMPVIQCANETEAFDYVAYLRTNNNSANPEWLYRGQHNRYFRLWPPVDETNFQRHSIEMDSLIPLDYRQFEPDREPPHPPSYWSDRARHYSDDAVRFRSILAWAIISEYAQTLPANAFQQVTSWLNQQTNSNTNNERFDRVESVGQHYGFSTQCLDWSSNINVAFWFATRDFLTGQYQAAGTGVLYVLSRTGFETIALGLNNANNWTGQTRIRAVTLAGTPAVLGQRSQNQAGWSLINFQSPSMMQALIQNNAIEVILFPRNAGPSAYNNLLLGYINPTEPLKTIFDSILNRTQPLFTQHRQDTMNNFLPFRVDLNNQFPEWINYV